MPSPEVVSCPGCGKRYSVPAGVPPGQFQCQDCHAVVAYGGAPGSNSGGPAGRASARKHAKAAAAKRRLDRSRDRDDDYDDDRGQPYPGRQRGQNPMVYFSAFAVIALLVGGMAFWHKKTTEQEALAKAEAARARAEKEEKEKAEMARIQERIAAEEAEMAAAAAKKVERKPTSPRPAPGSGPSPSPAPGSGGMSAQPRSNAVVAGDPVKLVDNPPTGGNYGKTQSEILIALKEKRSSIITDLPHLPDTSSADQATIDADVKAIADPGSGGAAIKAEERLTKIGRAAIPRVLSITANLDFSKYKSMAEARDACVVASSVDRILREITGYTTPPRLQFTPEGRIDEYPVCIEEWYVWWLTTGYKRANFYKTSAPKPAEDERL